MKSFYIVCKWDHYYPSSGIGNIVLVTNSLHEAEVVKEEHSRQATNADYDNCKIFHSSDLPWSKQ
jgi:hypothetical protein